MSKPKRFSDQLREAIERSGISRYRISREAGVSEGQLCRFMAGEGLSLRSIDALAEYLGLELTARAKQQKKGK